MGGPFDGTFRQIGLAAGVAALGSIFTVHVTAAMTDALAGLPLPAAAGEQLAQAVGSGAGVQIASRVPAALASRVAQAARAATASGVSLIFVVGAVSTAVVTVVSFVVMRQAVAEPSGKLPTLTAAVAQEDGR